MQYAKDLMKIAPNMSVIYVTGFNDRYAQHILLEDVKLVGYLTKPLNAHILERYLEKIVKSRESKLFVFSMRGKEYMIVPENIIYFESANHIITIHTDEDEYTFYDKLDCIQERLPSFFLRCHKSYLVSMKRIAQVEPTQIRLPDGMKIPISRINREQVRKASVDGVMEMTLVETETGTYHHIPDGAININVFAMRTEKTLVSEKALQ